MVTLGMAQASISTAARSHLLHASRDTRTSLSSRKQEVTGSAAYAVRSCRQGFGKARWIMATE